MSGFTRDKLIGHKHNLARHPDMPPAAFADLWRNLKRGTRWMGIVENRCKDSSYYWVDADVTPIRENGEISQRLIHAARRQQQLLEQFLRNRRQALACPQMRNAG